MRLETMRTYCLFSANLWTSKKTWTKQLCSRINSRIPPCKPMAAGRTTCEHGAASLAGHIVLLRQVLISTSTFPIQRCGGGDPKNPRLGRHFGGPVFC